jgi:hypothetical protein
MSRNSTCLRAIPEKQDLLFATANCGDGSLCIGTNWIDLNFLKETSGDIAGHRNKITLDAKQVRKLQDLLNISFPRNRRGAMKRWGNGL